MKIGNKDVNNYMGLKFEFSGVRILDETLYPARWNLELNLVAVDYNNNRPHEEMQKRGNVAFQKIYFWLETVLPGVVLTNVNNSISSSIVNSIDNMMLFSPGEPTDDLLVQLIHAKISAIAGEYLHIGQLKLNASDTTTTYTFSVDDEGYQLPTKIKDYIDLPSLYRIPWWHRPDGFSFEFLKRKGQKGKLSDIYNDVEDPLRHFEQLLLDDITIQEEPAKIIQVERWKPKQV